MFGTSRRDRVADVDKIQKGWQILARTSDALGFVAVALCFAVLGCLHSLHDHLSTTGQPHFIPRTSAISAPPACEENLPAQYKVLFCLVSPLV